MIGKYTTLLRSEKLGLQLRILIHTFTRMQVLFNVICIDDSDRPNDIPICKWIKKGEIYTVIQVDVLTMQHGKIGFKLAEKNIDEYFPYQYFSHTRFAILFMEPQVDWAQELLDNILEEAIEEEKLGILGKD